jgi:multidrug efflux pump
MQVSDLFIRRPVFAVVVSLLLMVGGFAALIQLPVREYPAVDPPVVSISTVYRGASNEVIESRITEIIEGAVAGLEGIRQITSESRNDRSSVSIEFNVNRDPEAATSDVRDAVSRIIGQLPDGVDTPVVRKVDANAGAIMWIAVTSTTLDALELSDYLKRVYVDRLATVEGVANVYIGGERRFAMRIWVDRGALAARGLTVQDIESAIRRQNVELPGGRIESAQRELTVKTDSRLSTPEQFERIIVQNRNNYLVRLGEVARVEVGAEDSAVRVLPERPGGDRARHRAPVHGEYPVGGERRPGRARPAERNPAARHHGAGLLRREPVPSAPPSRAWSRCSSKASPSWCWSSWSSCATGARRSSPSSRSRSR